MSSTIDESMTAGSYRDRGFLWLSGLFLCAAVPLTLLGYGSDNDTYQELDAGAHTWNLGVAETSRHPGYWMHEALIHFLGLAGGSLLVNITTMVVSLCTLYRVWLIASRLQIAWRLPICLCIAWNPWYLIASTSAIDYVWAIFFIVLSIEAFARNKPYVAGILGAIAIGFRLGSIFPIAAAFTAASLSEMSYPVIRRWLIAGAIASLLGLCFYFPSWLLFGKSFLQGHVGADALWTFKMHLGRALYKPLYLIGLVADMFVLALLVVHFKRISSVLKDQRGMVRAAFGAVAGNLVLFSRYPIEYSYLLPAVPFGMLLIGVLIKRASPVQAWGLVVSTVCFWFFSLPLAEPNIANSATDASYGLRLESGVLMRDIKMRRVLLGCNSLACYENRLSRYSYTERAPL